MTFEDKLERCLKLGVRKDLAEHFLSMFDGGNCSVLPAFRLLRSLYDYLQFYKGGYAELLKKQQEKGYLPRSVKKLVEKGVTLEEIQELKYCCVDETISNIMGLLCGMQTYESDIFKNEAFSECGRACIISVPMEKLRENPLFIQ